jgi:deazaflavin-dependent oxidoreductase (nitroreductase family)
MVLPRWLATLNRRGTNRIAGSLATRTPGFGVIVHRGRRSGRTFRTPVNVFQAAEGYLVALTYGVESDWVKNVMAAGGCELESRGRREQLDSPRIVHDQSRRDVPFAIRPILGLIGVSDFLALRIGTSPG